MCHGQLGQLHNALPDIRQLDGEVLAIDPHEAWAAKALLNQSGLETDDVHLPVLTDPALVVSAMYGVAFQMRIHEEISNRPATFVIDQDGVVRYQRRATHFADRPSVKEILDELGKL